MSFRIKVAAHKARMNPVEDTTNPMSPYEYYSKKYSDKGTVPKDAKAPSVKAPLPRRNRPQKHGGLRIRRSGNAHAIEDCN